VLVTGGAGFIGSHTCLELLKAGHSLVVLDNFHNGALESLRRVARLAGLGPWRSNGPGAWSAEAAGEMRLRVVEADLCRQEEIGRAIRAGETIDAVIHFAGLKSVAESALHPLDYWSVNVGGSCQLLQAMRDVGCRTMVFSSSATIYGHAATVPIPETAPIQPINPYGHTKVAVETMLGDLHRSEPGWRVACLRYFNPVGAHPSGLLGEDPRAQPTNLFPLMLQVAFGDRERLQIFGSDWPTPDGTGIRDYIHVMDLAEAHRRALELLLEEPPQLLTLNLGSGRGSSVLEMVSTLERTCGCRVPTHLTDRREEDSAISIADCSLAWARLGWQARRSLEDICRDGFRWKRENPVGYDTPAPTRWRSGAPGAGT
jgi:UDP-glucose 4-epimerase